MEGYHCFNPSTNCDSIGLIGPVWEYPHIDSDVSVTGGYVYRGSSTPALEGIYIYGDFSSGRIWGLDYQGDTSITNYLIKDTELNIPTFGVDEENELYIADFPTRKLYKLVNAIGSVDEGKNTDYVRLHPAVPNPTQTETDISYTLEKRGHVAIIVTNTLGERVAQLVDRTEEAGTHHIEFDVRTLPTGVYYIHLTTNNAQISQKVTVTH